MSKEAAVRFLEVVQEKPQLRQQVHGLEADQSPDNLKRILDIGAKEGYRFSQEELTSAVKARTERQMKSGEIAEEDLEKVAGGRECSWTCTITCLVTGSAE